jgi:hypothetical protein
LVQSIIQNSMLNGEVIRLDGAIRMQPWLNSELKWRAKSSEFLFLNLTTYINNNKVFNHEFYMHSSNGFYLLYGSSIQKVSSWNPGWGQR